MRQWHRASPAARGVRDQPPRRVSEWLAATLEMWCPERGCGFESRALRCCEPLVLWQFSYVSSKWGACCGDPHKVTVHSLDADFR